VTPDRLPCGAPVGRLIEQVADGRGGDPTPHQQSCLHCQAALAEYDRLWAPVHQLAAEPVPVPDGLLEQVLQPDTPRMGCCPDHAGTPASPSASSRSLPGSPPTG
jgi:hypothetical protein